LQAWNEPKKVVRRTVRGKGFASTQSYTTNTFINCPWTHCDVLYSTTITDEITVECGMVCDIELTLPSTLGIDASGMLALPWELLPFSFVADWFVNVGAFLNSAIPYLTKKPVSAWTKTTRLQTRTVKVLSATASAGHTVDIARQPGDVYVTTIKTVTRDTSVPSPGIVVRPNSLSNVLADARVVDGLTLIAQKILRI